MKENIWSNPIDTMRRGLDGGMLKLLTDKEVALIQEGAERLLFEKPCGGVKCDHEETMEIMKKHGAEVDYDKKRIWIPRDVIRHYIKKAPSKIIMGARDPQHDLDLGGKRVYFGSGGAPTQIIRLAEKTIDSSKCGDLKKLLDNESVDRSKFKNIVRGILKEEVAEYHLQDLINTARLAQAQKYLNFYLRSGEPLDLPEGPERDLNKVYYALQNTVKHVMAGYFKSAETFRLAVKLATIIAGSEEKFRARPLLSVVVCLMVPPRVVDGAVAEIFIEAARQGAPVAASSDPIMGFTTPPTRGALLTQLHAEQLFAIVLAQMVKEGAPVIPGYVVGVGNMQKPDQVIDASGYQSTGRYRGFLGGTVPGALMNASVAQLAHSQYMDVPVYNTAGLTDSKAPDSQAALEKMMSVLLSAMTGVNYIHHAAGFRKDMSEISYLQYVIDAEIIGMCAEILNGITVSDKTLMVEEMLKKDPGENFLNLARFTARRIRKGTEKEFYLPSKLIDLKDREDWEVSGCLCMHEKAEKLCREILEKGESIPFEKDVENKIRKQFGRFLV